MIPRTLLMPFIRCIYRYLSVIHVVVGFLHCQRRRVAFYRTELIPSRSSSMVVGLLSYLRLSN